MEACGEHTPLNDLINAAGRVHNIADQKTREDLVLRIAQFTKDIILEHATKGYEVLDVLRRVTLSDATHNCACLVCVVSLDSS